MAPSMYQLIILSLWNSGPSSLTALSPAPTDESTLGCLCRRWGEKPRGRTNRLGRPH